MSRVLVLIAVGVAMLGMTGCETIGKGKGKGTEPVYSEPVTK